MQSLRGSLVRLGGGDTYTPNPPFREYFQIYIVEEKLLIYVVYYLLVD